MVAYYHKMFSKDDCKTIFDECRKGQRGCVDCKKELSKNINTFLTPIREKRKYYEQRPELVKQIIYEGTNEAREKARETMKKVKEAVKINYFEE